MFTERQFDNYSDAMRDLRNHPGDTSFDRVIEAFNLGLKKTPGVIKTRLMEAGKGPWFSLAAILWEGLTYVIKIQAGAVLIGAVLGGAALSEVPVVGTAAGAAFGARIGLTVASWYLTAIGLGSMVAIAGQVGGVASVDFEQGVKMAKSGDVEGGSIHIAVGFATILELVAAIVILFCFVRGGQRVIGKINTAVATESRLLSMLKSLPAPLSNGRAYFNTTKWAQRFSEGWGYSYEEILALKQMSTNGKIYVVRTCNPARTAVGNGVALEGKGLEIKGKSMGPGLHEGKVGVDAADIAKLKTKYTFEELPHKSGYRMKLQPGKQGELNNCILERADYTAFGKDGGKMVLLDPTGRPFIPDMDRLVCMALDANSGTVSNPMLKDLARFGDDPAEIAEFNAQLNNILGNKKVNVEAAKHGYTSSSVKPDGKPIWHADSNETLLVFAESKIFEMTWNQFVLFCEANKAIGLPQCFSLVTP